MSIFTGFIVYFIIWWTALFTVLPWGVRQSQVSPQEGMQAAPENPNLKAKFIATTILSFVVWLIVYILIEIEIINFRELANQWIIEDKLP